MPIQNFDSIRTNDVWVEHPHGRIYSRIWSLSNDINEDNLAAPIVLFHDSLGCIDLWRDFPLKLCMATGRKIIAYDRLGFGKSESRLDNLTVKFIEDEAKTYFPYIRKQLGITDYIAFGHSVGGGMAIHCAAMYPDDCKALITESAQIFAEDRTLEGISAAREQFQHEGQVERLKKYHGEKTRWVLGAWIETWLAPEFKSWSLINLLAEVKCPVLAIHGIYDEYGSVRHPEMIGQLCSGPKRVKIIPDTYHVPHREQPERILDLVSEFTSTVAR